jgi:ubiquinone/menaquinone biosynthesis C-methylase UbiE
MNKENDTIRAQYQDDRNLNARIQLHARFSTNTYGWSTWVFDHFSFPENARILELGCGPGGLWAANRQRIVPGWHIILTDFSTGMVTRAHESLASGEGLFNFATADAQATPFPNAHFDIVIANHMLYHVPDQRGALVEIRRILKPSGSLYATTVGDDHMQEMWDLLLPFVPDVHDRVYEVVRGFSLQNGPAQLGGVFEQVNVHVYPDDLRVTDEDALMAYLKSSPTSIVDDLTQAQLEALHATVATRIATEGTFRIRKSSGLLVAGKQ